MEGSGTAGPDGPADPVPVAVYGRASTIALQDTRASLRRQVRSSLDKLPPGFYIAAYYWDIESGGIDLEDRSQGETYKQFTDAGIPHDGGMADLISEATSPTLRFAAVICEDIERSGRDTFTLRDHEAGAAEGRGGEGIPGRHATMGTCASLVSNRPTCSSVRHSGHFRCFASLC